MNKYYVSQYLNVIDLEDSALLFNGINGCMDAVSRKLGDGLREKDAQALSFLPQKDLEFLAGRGHLTTLAPETEQARFREFAAALHGRRERQVAHGGIMLLMSYNCNLACKYCYQQEHRPHKSRAVMTEKFVEDLFESHISSVLPGIELKNTEISFYGGEPFLPANLPVIRKALDYAKRYGMSSRAISNATQVDSMPDIFGAGPGKVNYVQVSLDGDRELHDKSRIPASGEGTFDKIVDNIALMLKQGTHVNIRLNLDRRTLASVKLQAILTR